MIGSLKRLLSIALVIAMLSCSFTSVGFAEGSVIPEGNIELGVSSLEEDEVPEMVFQPLTAVDLDELMESYSTPFNSPSELSIDTLTGGTELFSTNTFGLERSATQSWTGTLAKQGDFTYALA